MTPEELGQRRQQAAGPAAEGPDGSGCMHGTNKRVHWSMIQNRDGVGITELRRDRASGMPVAATAANYLFGKSHVPG
jgi:hypothetical protein